MMATIDQCEVFCFDEEKVNRLKRVLQAENFKETTQILKSLADETRMKIAYILCQEKELCVCDVANIIGSTMATASHHLRFLKNKGLAKYRKEGKLVFYSLDDEHVKQLVIIAHEHGKERKSHEK
jgi:DNA-binding transcriptional ArsR family regulator